MGVPAERLTYERAPRTPYLALRRVTKRCACRHSTFNEQNSVSLQAFPTIAKPIKNILSRCF
jgi:hypothetical protein